MALQTGDSPHHPRMGGADMGPSKTELLGDLPHQGEELAGSGRIILPTDTEASLPGSTAS